MRPISKRTFPRRTLQAAQALACLPKLPQPHALRNVSHNLAWTLSIMDRLVHRSRWTGRHPESMVLALAARNYILLRTLLKQLQPGTQTGSNPVKERGRLGASQVKQWPYGPGQVAILRQVVREKPIGVSVEAILRQAAHHHPTPRPAMLIASVQESRSPVLATKRAGLPHSQPIYGNAMPPAPLVLPMARRPLVQPWLSPPEEGDELDLGTRDMPARVTRKHRRVEGRPYPRVHDLTAKNEPALMPANRFTLEKPWLPQPAQEYQSPTSKFERTAARSQPEPAVNVARITDEVLKQLDKRLVAARERMGRI